MVAGTGRRRKPSLRHRETAVAMKRRHSWLSRAAFTCLLLIVAVGVAAAWLLPVYLRQAIRQLTNGELSISEARIALPLAVTVTDLKLTGRFPETALSVQRVAVNPRWPLISSKSVSVDAVEIERPFVRVTRAPSGALLWPFAHGSSDAGGASPRAIPVSLVMPEPRSPWRVRIGSVHVIDATIEWIDRKPSVPLHALFDHVSLVFGPVAVPPEGSQMSFAIRGKIVGFGGHAAPCYCSGWVDVDKRDLEASCQLEPIALAAFEPYFRSVTDAWFRTATLESTSHWSARGNEMASRVQLALAYSGDTELTIHGRSIVDTQRTAGAPHRLSGEISLTGPLDDPAGWYAELLPGDDPVQQWVRRLLSRGVEIVTIPLLGRRIGVNLTPASKVVSSSIQETSREIREALEILAVPVAEDVLQVGGVSADEGAPVTVPPAVGSEEGKVKEPQSSEREPDAPMLAPSPSGPLGLPRTAPVEGTPAAPPASEAVPTP